MDDEIYCAWCNAELKMYFCVDGMVEPQEKMFTILFATFLVHHCIFSQYITFLKLLYSFIPIYIPFLDLPV